jgi:hypothetical protein
MYSRVNVSNNNESGFPRNIEVINNMKLCMVTHYTSKAVQLGKRCPKKYNSKHLLTMESKCGFERKHNLVLYRYSYLLIRTGMYGCT